MNTQGGWSGWKVITPDAEKIFKKGLGNLTGVGYVPVAFDTQVVAGTNYLFLCIATVVVPDAKGELKTIKMWHKTDGNVEMNKEYGIKKVDVAY